jgi:hypothetical protein
MKYRPMLSGDLTDPEDAKSIIGLVTAEDQKKLFVEELVEALKPGQEWIRKLERSTRWRSPFRRGRFIGAHSVAA